MKVISNERELCPFVELEPGDVFKCGCCYYMKFDTDIGEPNAVNLEDGGLLQFSAGNEVLPVEGEFVVR